MKAAKMARTAKAAIPLLENALLPLLGLAKAFARSKGSTGISSTAAGTATETLAPSPLCMAHGIELCRSIIRMAEIRGFTITTCRTLLLEGEHEGGYSRSLGGKPGAASAATYGMYVPPLQIIEKEDARGQVSELMDSPRSIRVPSFRGLPEIIEEGHVGYEALREKGGTQSARIIIHG